MTELKKENEVNSILASLRTVQPDDRYQVKMDYLLIKVDEMKNKLKMFTELFSKFSIEVGSSLEVMEMELKILKKDKNDKGNQYEDERSFNMMTSTTPENKNVSMMPNNLLTSENFESDLDENILVRSEICNDLSQKSEGSSHISRVIKPYIDSYQVQQFVGEIEVGEEFKTKNLSFNETPTDHQKVSNLIVSKSLRENTYSLRDSKCKKSYSSESTQKKKKNYSGYNKTKTAESSLMLLSNDYCEYKTYCKKNISDHAQTKHLPKYAKLYECSECKKTYLSNSSLWRHLKVCGRPKNQNRTTGYLSCDHCTYKCSYKQHLVNHIQSKHSSDTFKCTACCKSFGTQDSLRLHTNYNCKILAAHRRLSCDHCTYKCSRKNDLVIHVKSKHSHRFECAACSKSFSSQYYLKKHNERVGCKKNKSL